jgi:hypothetical protein
MSGAAGIRGYLLQTLSCLLESLEVTSTWEAVSIEPNALSEKVDVLWRWPDRTRVAQIKSSQNQIGKAAVELWAQELETSIAADEYELSLLGPCSQWVVTVDQIGKVRIPTPRVLDVSGLVEQAAHRLDRYFEVKGISRVPAFARELLVHGMIGKLETYSTSGDSVLRADFDRLLTDWVLSIYPQAFSSAVAMQCDLLLDSFVFPQTTAPSHDSFPLVLPMVLVNGGIRTAVIEWIAAKIKAEDHIKLYTPVALIDLQRLIQGRRALHAENIIGQFSEFPVLPGQACPLNVLFAQEENDARYPFRSWESGRHTVELHVKYHDRDTAIQQRSFEIDVTPEMLQQFRAGGSFVNSIRRINI